MAASNVVTTVVPPDFLGGPQNMISDPVGNLFLTDWATAYPLALALPHVYLDTNAIFENVVAGQDSLAQVLPATEDLNPPFYPTSDSPWLTICGVTNGVVSFSFTTNSGPARTATIQLFGENIPVTQGLIGAAPIYLSAQPAPGDVMMLSFTNIPGAAFTVLTSTNPDLPRGQWVVAGLPTEISLRQYSFTNPVTIGQQFFTVRTP